MLCNCLTTATHLWVYQLARLVFPYLGKCARFFFYTKCFVSCRDQSIFRSIVVTRSAPHTFAPLSCIRKAYSRMSISVFAKWRLACVLQQVTTILVKIDRSRLDTKHFVERKKHACSCPHKETLSAESCYLINPHVGSCVKTVT